MKSKLILAILLFCCTSSFAQDYMVDNTLPLNDSIAFASLRYSNKDYGYGVINSKGILAWQVPSNGYPLGMSKFNDNVIVFFTDSNKDLKAFKEVHAMIIDLKAQKIKIDKAVYTSNSNYQFDPWVMNDPAGNFNFLLIRTMRRKRGFAALATSWPEDKSRETNQLTAVYLDDQLNDKTSDIKSIAFDGNFLSACAGSNKDWYLCSYAKDELTVEKFDGGNNLKSKISTPTSFSNHSGYYPLMKYDSLPGNCINEAVAYTGPHNTDMFRTYRFDFNEQKTFATDETVLNKNYVKTLAKMNGDKSKLSNFKFIEHLMPVQILETNDKVIVVKEIRYESGGAKSVNGVGNDAVGFNRTGSLISIYSKNDLHPERDIIIDKDFGTFGWGGIDIASHIHNGQLYTATCELTSPGKYKMFLYISNINDGSTEQKIIEKTDAGKGWITYPATICWFSKNFITPFTTTKSFQFKPESVLQSASY